MTNILANFIGRLFNPGMNSVAALSAEDRELLAAVEASDTMDEPTAYALILLEVALSDGTVDDSERTYIERVLASHFSLKASRANILVQKAQHLVNSFRGLRGAIASVKSEFSPEERRTLRTMIKGVMDADGKQDSGEVLIEQKIEKLLGAE